MHQLAPKTKKNHTVTVMQILHTNSTTVHNVL